MDLKEIKDMLESSGSNPDDFNISILKNSYTVTPKWFFETKQIAKKEDKPIITDVNEVAMTSAFILEDSTTTAEMVGYLLMEVESLKDEIEILKGGI